MSGPFVICLDFELLLDVRYHAGKQAYWQNILGAREAVLRMLELFEPHGIRATWATVGFLFCETKDESMAALPAVLPLVPELSRLTQGWLHAAARTVAADPDLVWFYPQDVASRAGRP
jgi:hypothetical protein